MKLKIMGIKKMMFIFLMFITITLNGTIYYVAPSGGSDSNAGTNISAPWATWGKAFTTANDDDTVYFRGGIYNHTVTNGTGYEVTVDGTSGHLIYFLNYPDEVPILDCDNVASATGDINVAIDISGVNYVKFRGLVVRNVWQFDGNDTGVGWLSWGITGVEFERCTTYNVHGIGFLIYGSWGSYFINCDAHHCADSLSTTRPGNTGSGFQYINFSETNTSTYYIGCRAWMCSDQGFALGSAGYTEYDNCWAWANGYLTGEGDGFKLGWMGAGSSNLQILVKNCISAYNSEAGFNDNSSTSDPAGYLNIYNNTSYNNSQYGFMFFNTASNDAAELNRITRNNISFQDGAAVFNQSGSLYTHEYNSWDIPITVTSADFVSIDSTGIRGARQADGSLPNVTFLKLTSTSDLIDSGTDVGLTYNGSGPDLGYTEHQAVDVDGNYYDYLTIGSQVWFTDNLKTTKYNDNSSISNVTNNAAWMALSTAAYSWYNNDEAYKETYGALYNWHAVNTEDLCPTGWHVPTDAEFKVLEMELGMSESQSDASFWRGTTEGTELKSSSNWFKSGNGTNTSGFNSQPTGFRYSQDGGFYNFGLITYWWTSSEYNSTNAYCRRLDYNKAKIYRWGNLKVGGKPVRCIQD